MIKFKELLLLGVVISSLSIIPLYNVNAAPLSYTGGLLDGAVFQMKAGSSNNLPGMTDNDSSTNVSSRTIIGQSYNGGTVSYTFSNPVNIDQFIFNGAQAPYLELRFFNKDGVKVYQSTTQSFVLNTPTNLNLSNIKEVQFVVTTTSGSYAIYEFELSGSVIPVPDTTAPAEVSSLTHIIRQ